MEWTGLMQCCAENQAVDLRPKLHPARSQLHLDRLHHRACPGVPRRLPAQRHWCAAFLVITSPTRSHPTPRDHGAAIAEGIYLTIESLGAQGDVCFFDNVVLEELIPSTKYATVRLNFTVMMVRLILNECHTAPRLSPRVTWM